MSTWSLCRHPTHPHTTLQICGFGHATEPTHTDCKQTWQLQQTHTHKHTCGLKTPNSGKQLAFTYLSINEIHQSSMKSTSEIHLPISDQWNPPISDKWNPPVNPPVYRETHLSVKSTYQSNLPVYQSNPPVYQSNLPVYQWNPPISQIHISVKSTYQSNPPISQIYLSIGQIHLSVKSTCLSTTCLSVKSTYQSNLPVYQSNPPVKISLSTFCLHGSHKKTSQQYWTCCQHQQKPSNRHRFFSPKQLPTLTHKEGGSNHTATRAFIQREVCSMAHN